MKRIIFPVLMVVVLILVSCSTPNNETKSQKVKYVFYFIGDGLSLPQLSLTEAWMAQTTQNHGMQQTNQSKMQAHGWFYTHANNRFITGSAAAGTALATGQKTSINTIGKTANRTINLESIAVKAKKVGRKVGIVSSVSIDHATPAAFYAHADKRNQYYAIGKQLFTSGFDLFAGGGFKDSIDGENNRPNLYETQSGFTILRTNAAFSNATKTDLPLYFAHERLTEGAAMPYAIDMDDNDLSLATITEKSIELLDNEEGFFLMVEGGKIDWACHANDAATTVHEVVDFDNAVGEAMEFASQRPNETLIVVLGDHETGGLTLGNRALHYETNFTLLNNQIRSLDALAEAIKPLINKKAGFQEALMFIDENMGLGTSIELSTEDKNELEKSWNESINYKHAQVTFLYGSVQKFLQTALNMLNEKAGVGWTTGSHTGLPVIMHAHGVGADKFDGILDNTDIPILIEEIIHQ
ncbi:MAG: alkaline phosphatase [Salinivirgaceae bacterium]|jgi:alkaline phosphatase|nr:alkaline phosphatase [Salinivirgaceae bacterium]